MKKFLAFIIAVAIMSTSLIGCGKQETETFDWGGITIDIPTDYKLNYDHAYDNKFGRGNQSVLFAAENYTGIMIVCMQGAYTPDDKAALGNDTIIETLEEDKYTMDGYEVRYGNYKTNSTDNIKLFTHVFSLYLSDRWIVVQAYTGSKKINKEQKSIIDSIKISDNQYEYPCFDTSTGTSISEEPKQTEIIDLNDLRPSPTPTENPFQYEYYGFYDISIPIPVGFKYNEELSNEFTDDNRYDTFIFQKANMDDGSIASITIEDLPISLDPNSVSNTNFGPSGDLLDPNNFLQEYFDINGNVIKSIISSWFTDEERYIDFDIAVCLDNHAIFINMAGPEYYRDTFKIAFDYIGDDAQ